MTPGATYDFFSQNPHLEPKSESGFLLNKLLLLIVDTRGQQGHTTGKVCSFPQKPLSVWERHFQKVSPQISKANRQKTVAGVFAAARASFPATAQICKPGAAHSTQSQLFSVTQEHGKTGFHPRTPPCSLVVQLKYGYSRGPAPHLQLSRPYTSLCPASLLFCLETVSPYGL